MANRTLQIFISSPGDVNVERKIAFEIIEKLNRDPVLRDIHDIKLNGIGWERLDSRVPMLAYVTPQEAINKGMPMPGACEIVVVIFWGRMGTPVPDTLKKPDGTRYESGTEFEYVHAFEAATKSALQPPQPHLVVYRRTEKVMIDADAPDAVEKLAQRRKVEQFFARFKAPDGSLKGGINDYTSPDDFREKLEQDLRFLMKQYISDIPVASIRPGISEVMFPALSVHARTSRPTLTSTLIGRDEDLKWLRKEGSDRLLVGQPGTGKTFLFRKLVDEGLTFFVVSTDRSQLLASIGKKRPKVLIVDDDVATDDLDNLLLNLIQIRQELKHHFIILVGSWPGNTRRIVEILNLAESQVHTLQLLSRDQIVEVVKAVGLVGPIELIREIVSQAEGRPGLAVTLTDLCLRDDTRRVVMGEAISDTILGFFSQRIGPRATELMAGFSVGGDSGMSMQSVAVCLGLTIVEVRDAIITFELAGSFLEVDEEHMSVRPPSLRYVLVSQMFFQGAKSLDIEPFLVQTPNMEDAMLTIIGARARGAHVQDEWLIPKLKTINSLKLWRNFASLGQADAKWVQDHCPDIVEKLLPTFLELLPQSTIPLLLKSAIGDVRPLNSSTNHPIRLIKDWVLAGRPGTGDGVRRRKLLFEEVQKWLLNAGDTTLALSIVPIILSPAFEDFESDPGSGRTITIYRNILTKDELLNVQAIWSALLVSFGSKILSDWAPLRELIHEWAYNMNQVSLSDEITDIKRNFAATLIRDLGLVKV